MTICKFFARGNCRKGNNCNFEHVLPNDNYHMGGASIMRRNESSEYTKSNSFDDYSGNKRYGDQRYSNYPERNVVGHSVSFNNDYYSERPGYRQYDQQFYNQRYHNDKYHYDPRQNQYKPQSYQKEPIHNKNHITTDEVYKLLKSEIDIIESCRIWPLTSFSLIKLFGSLEDWVDYSPEEMRFAAYIAKETNNFDGYKATHDKIVSHAQSIREFYKHSSKVCSAKIKSYLNQDGYTIHPLVRNELDFSQVNYSSLEFSSNTDFVNTQTNVFGSSDQRQTEDMEMASAPKSENIFGSFQSGTSGSSSIFSQDNKQSSPFFQNQIAPSNNVFGFSQNSSQSTGNVFGKPQVPFGSEQNVGRNVFNKPDDEPPKDLTVLFPKLKNTDLSVEILSSVWCGNSPYSRHADLTEEEIEQFKAPRFTLGKIPLVPPSKELC